MVRVPGCQLPPVPLLFAALACAPDLSGQPVWVISRADDGSYGLSARDLPELTDPSKLIGDRGHGWRGGTLTLDGYHHGGALHIDAIESDGALLPLDEDGLVLWSFYADLVDATDALEARGYDVSPIVPVDIAFAPASFMDFSAVENAAYVLGQRAFVIFPDALSGLPLAANAGVVRHEFGHAWFELLTTGRSGEVVTWSTGVSTTGTLRIRALNEGFADTVASLTLDDPRFIEASLDMPERAVTNDVISTDLYPTAADSDLLGALTYDPYALGTVYAGFAWDVRVATDPDTALDLAQSAAAAWGAEAAWEDTDRYVALFVEHAQGPARDAACASAAHRFPQIDLPECR